MKIILLKTSLFSVIIPEPVEKSHGLFVEGARVKLNSGLTRKRHRTALYHIIIQ